MKVPLNWLREYVNVSLPVAELVRRLTLAGLEVSAVHPIGVQVPEGVTVPPEDRGPVWDRDKIIIARVLRVERHPNADRLTLVTLDYGAAEPKTVVTGAPNLHVGDAGQKVILALVGSRLYDGHAAEKVFLELKSRNMRGIVNDAMVCSARELGISDEHEGIILLGDDAPVGKPFQDYAGDLVVEIDVLPNLARCLSMIGVAREVAALTGHTLRRPPGEPGASAPGGPGAPIEGKVQVEIEDPKLCARYAAALLARVKIGPAPDWMQWQLTYAGVRPISNIVDITNYVMLEWGQPLHAFDYDVLRRRAGGKTPVITVRPARAGEALTTLDGKDRKLLPENLVIADTAGPIALAGVMGGRETEVSAATTNVLLESANFDAISIRRTARALDLVSEASTRFSRGIHPEIVRPAAERAAVLMRLHAGATICRGLVDNYPAPLPPQVVELSLREVRRLLGMEFPPLEVLRILEALEFRVENAGPETLRVTVPPHRLDVQAGSADLIEELVRIHGYDSLPATELADRLPEQHANPMAGEEHVRDVLVAAGLQEVITYRLTVPEREAPLEMAEGEYVRLQNPISSERVVMRHSVLAGVLEVAAANVRHTDDVRLFELGAVYLPRPGAKLPDEPGRLALALTGRRIPDFWADGQAAPKAELDFFDLKGIVEALAHDLHLPDVSFRTSAVPYLHPGRAAELVLGDKPAGSFGQLHPQTAETYGLGGRTVLAGELNLEAILAAMPERFTWTPVPRFPPALRDIAVIVAEDVTAESVEQAMRAAGADLLRGIRLFDLYRGESIPAGTKSLAYALAYQAEDRTLIDKEVDRVHKKIEDRLKHVLQARIRGKDTSS
jgi:phenylalanyl-tRNA synthetase beta chain